MTAGNDEAPVTATLLRTALERQPDGAGLDTLAERLRTQIGVAQLVRGMEPLIEGLTVAWAIAATGAVQAPEIVAERGSAYRARLIRLGTSEIYALAVTLPAGTAMQSCYVVDGTRRERGAAQGIVETYAVDSASLVQPGVPHGTLIAQPLWRSTVFAGTERDWWVFLPANYDGQTVCRVMVFQDGGQFYKDHVPTVFDNLMAADEMPATIGVFLNPGTYADTTVSNRSFEYDTLSDRYARFLLEEILPYVARDYSLRQDAAGRAIAGFSSGAICAFTAAWQRPNQFSRVVSWAGSFTNIAAGPTLREGGHNYPALIRRLPRKPLRIFLQAGSHDLDNEWGNWSLANQEMAAALAFAGYEHRFVHGQGFHTTLHGRALLPEALRWLWKEP